MDGPGPNWMRSPAVAVAAVAFALAPVPAQGLGDDGGEGAAAGAAGKEISSRGAIAAFAAVSGEGGAAVTSSTTYEPVAGMVLMVRALRRSQLVISFTAECKPYPPDTHPDSAVAVLVEARVNGERVQGVGEGDNIVFCADKEAFFESHSFRWVHPVGRRVTNEVTIHFHYSGPDGGRAELADRILDVFYTPS